jgi:aminopeptidase N
MAYSNTLADVISLRIHAISQAMKSRSSRPFRYIPCVISVLLSVHLFAQKGQYSHADSLKGSIGKARDWWDVTHYELHVKFNEADSSLTGYNVISYKILGEYPEMQLDLMEPMRLDSVLQEGKKCGWRKDGDAYFVRLYAQKKGTLRNLTAYFHGKPRVAKNPPWDGGVVWKKDKNNNPWISVACQGMAARVWFPDKDHMYDEPDSASIYIEAPKELMAVSNGRLRSVKQNSDGSTVSNWAVVNPINDYNIIPYIGRYVNFKDTMLGEKGPLDLDFWVMQGNLSTARKHFALVKPMIHCFEEWFGPYPFYEDGYKLVEAPYLGMEHQSAIAYGNDYLSGYKGRDLSGSGWGLKWDFIIVHESGHEWFGNNISAKDVADDWIHEGFTTYMECIFVECLYGKEAGTAYVLGQRNSVRNDKALIGDYGVNVIGSYDVYNKGANVLHTLRQLVNNDTLWRAMFRALGKKFYHQTVTSAQIEQFIAGYLKLDLKGFFDQYLRHAAIPAFEYKVTGNKLRYRWNGAIKKFNMPLRIYSEQKEIWLKPSEKWKTMNLTNGAIRVDENFLITVIKNP